VPFVLTIVVTLIFASYMLLDPAEWLYHLMQLTRMSMGFKGWLFALAGGAFGVAYLSERQLFPEVARSVGKLIRRLRQNKPKKRKQYKVLLEDLRN
jgi:cation-transporting P-type ATPase 13A2